MESLENICKKLLDIDEKIPVSDICDFLEKNEVFNLDSLFLVNFKKKPLSLNSNVHKYSKHKILGFKEKFGKYGKYYLIYCRITPENEYRIYFSNKKITEAIDRSFQICDSHLVDFDVRIFKDYCFKKISPGVYQKKYFKDYINFYPEELNGYKGIWFREVDIY